MQLHCQILHLNFVFFPKCFKVIALVTNVLKPKSRIEI